VDPQEAPAPFVGAPPGDRAGHGLVSGSLGEGHERIAEPLVVVVVDLEAAVEPVAPVERQGRHERRGGEALGAQEIGQRIDALGEHEASVVVDAVLVGVAPREDARVRGQRDDRVRASGVECGPGCSETIEQRRFHTTCARESGRVVAQRIGGDQNDVRGTALPRRCSAIRVRRRGRAGQRKPCGGKEAGRPADAHRGDGNLENPSRILDRSNIPAGRPA
jgi:hypothetical protein